MTLISFFFFKKKGVMGSPKKKGLFKKPSSQPAGSSGGSFPVALSFGDDGICP
jgi:hypothetical protein